MTLTVLVTASAALVAPGAPAAWQIAGGVLVAALATATAASAWVAQRGRRAILGRLAYRPRQAAVRALGEDADPFAADTGPAWRGRLVRVMVRVVPPAFRSEAVTAQLAQAGYYAPDAAICFGAIRLAMPVLAPAVVLLVTRSTTPMALLLGLTVGVMGPTAMLDRRAGTRRTAVSVAIPDALDLLVVCLEAGVGLDAALVRVARELAPTHPLFSAELENATRRISAGLPRDEALRALVARTGVEDLRGIVSTMIQAERLGTSLARVLRIYGEALRARRRQLAEKRAAEASVKMVIPLVTFLLPAFFAIVLGPAVIGFVGNARTP